MAYAASTVCRDQRFTARITSYLSDAEYAELQNALIVNPELGDLIKGTGGLRKLRWGQKSRQKGKSGGIRTIYYWHSGEEQFFMVFAYEKSEQDDLTGDQKRILKAIVEAEFE